MGYTIWGHIGRIGTVLLLVALAGCNRVAIIYTIQDHPVAAQAQKLTPEQVSEAIAEAAQSAGWQVERMGPNALRATQKWHDHAAIVTITNTDRAFSIRNDGSTNLRATGEFIHKEYNSRVHKLETAIEQRLQQS